MNDKEVTVHCTTSKYLWKNGFIIYGLLLIQLFLFMVRTTYKEFIYQALMKNRKIILSTHNQKNLKKFKILNIYK